MTTSQTYNDPALRLGEAIAERVISAIRGDTSDPDHLMRALLQVIADSGYMLTPSTLLRGLCAELQREIANAAVGNTGYRGVTSATGSHHA